MKRIITYIALGFLLFFIGKVQTNIITSILFFLNISLLAWFAKGDSKPSTISAQLKCTNYIIRFSSFILMLEILFICFIGEVEKTN